MEIFAALKPQGIEHKIDFLLQLDNADDLRACWLGLKLAFDDLDTWVKSKTGNIVSNFGTHLLIQIPIDCLTELPNYTVKFEDTVGLPFTIGVGNSVLEATKAMLVADNNKTNHILVYSEEVEKELSGDEDGSFMSKAEDEQVGISMPNINTDEEPKKKPVEGEQKEVKVKVSSKQKVIAALSQVKLLLPQIQELKESNPPVYKSLKSVIDAMILLATKGQFNGMD